MPEHTPEEARSLFRGPPSYDDLQEMESFEIEDEDPLEDENGAPVSWFSRMTRFGKTKLFIPVRHVIDPVAHAWHAASMWSDRQIGRWMNPLIAKRVFFMGFIMCVVFLIYFLHYDTMNASGFSHHDHGVLRNCLHGYISKESIQDKVEFFGQMPHYAGSVGDSSTREFVLDSLRNAGLDAKLDRHDIYISHGNETKCELKLNGDIVYSSDLLEGEAIESPSQSQQQPRTQMALVWPGEAEGELVYVHTGSEADLAKLNQLKLDLNGKIAVAEYSSEQPGKVAMRLEAAGVKACLFYTNPANINTNGNTNIKSDTNWLFWPDGPLLPFDGIQQHSLGVSDLYPGDVLSPGWPSSMQLRVSRESTYLPHIPVAAMSFNDAQNFLGALKTHGTLVDEWSSKTNDETNTYYYEGWTGPAEAYTVRLYTSPIVEDRHQISNVVASMKGRETTGETVVIGARLDAMCYGVSQLSGLAVLLEIARAFSSVRYDKQWQPLRSVLFVAWDGTSQNFAGSTEWVESVSESLSREGLAYIDLDMGVSGPDFVVQGNPTLQFDDLIKHVRLNESFSLWDALDFDKSMFPVPGFANHLAFEAHTGVPTIKMGFSGYPAPIDSCFDSIDWMQRFGDPNMERHRALAEISTDVLLELCDSPFIPFDFQKLGDELVRYVSDIQRESEALIDQSDPHRQLLLDAVEQAKDHARDVSRAGGIYSTILHQWEEYAQINSDPSTNTIFESPPVAGLRLFWNKKVNNVCKAFLDRNGIDGRNWYKNHVFGPMVFDSDTEKLSGTFPAVRDALHQNNCEKALDVLNDAIVHVDKAAKYIDAMRL